MYHYQANKAIEVAQAPSKTKSAAQHAYTPASTTTENAANAAEAAHATEHDTTHPSEAAKTDHKSNTAEASTANNHTPAADTKPVTYKPPDQPPNYPNQDQSNSQDATTQP